MKGIVIGLPISVAIWGLLAIAYIMLTGCATMQPYATCGNARAVAMLATAAMARICPIIDPGFRGNR
jgi:hypothetical protein